MSSQINTSRLNESKFTISRQLSGILKTSKMASQMTASGAKTARVAKFNIVNDSFVEAYPIKVTIQQSVEKEECKKVGAANKQPSKVSLGYMTPRVQNIKLFDNTPK